MSFFLALTLAHLVADFLQPAALVSWSKRYTSGLLVHTASYMLLSGIVIYGVRDWWLWLSLLGFSHFVLDYIKYFTARRMGPSGSLFYFIIDQVFHMIIIATVVWGLGAIGVRSSWFLEALGTYRDWLPLAVGLIAATFGVSILIFELERTLLRPDTNNSVIGFKERVPGLAERGAAVVFMATGLFYLFPLAFVYSIYHLFLAWPTADRRRLLIEFTTGVAVTLAIGLVLVFL